MFSDLSKSMVPPSLEGGEYTTITFVGGPDIPCGPSPLCIKCAFWALKHVNTKCLSPTQVLKKGRNNSWNKIRQKWFIIILSDYYFVFDCVGFFKLLMEMYWIFQEYLENLIWDEVIFLVNRGTYLFDSYVREGQ